jgi:hypothetical protein
LSFLSLRAPIAVPVEVRAPAGRVFRLAASIGEDGLRLARPVPWEPGRPVDVRLVLPDAEPGTALALRAELDASGDGDGEAADQLRFLDAPESARAPLRRYVHDRLGLP